MDEQEVLNLFDFYWFEHKIFTNPPPSHLQIEQTPTVNETQITKPPISHFPSLHVRSHSDQLISETSSKSDPFSPNSVLQTPKLDTILSGKAVKDFKEETDTKQELNRPTRKPIGRRKKKLSKSLSDLEFEELKGFMDLGFDFSEAETDSRLVSIIPGLQRLGKRDGEGSVDGSSVSRPYLSEAWSVDRTVGNPLMNWRIPNVSDEIDMKDHLRFWAHSVASAVR